MSNEKKEPSDFSIFGPAICIKCGQPMTNITEKSEVEISLAPNIFHALKGVERKTPESRKRSLEYQKRRESKEGKNYQVYVCKKCSTRSFRIFATGKMLKKLERDKEEEMDKTTHGFFF